MSVSRRAMEVENIVLIVIFALLLFFVFMTGIIAYTLCPREPVVHQPRTWSGVLSILVLTLIRMDRTNPARRELPDRIEEEPDDPDLVEDSLTLKEVKLEKEDRVDIIIHQPKVVELGSV